MPLTDEFLKRAVGLGVFALLAACSDTAGEPGQPAGGTECVPVREGTLYRVENGLLVPLDALRPGETAPGAGMSTPARLVSEVRAAGFSWLSLDASGFDQGFAILTGEAPSHAARDTALARAENAIRANPEGRDLLLVDNVSVRGGKDAVGAAAAGLGRTPDPAACEAALTRTMRGRTMRFVAGTVEISGESRSLVDALAATALRCQAHEIEITVSIEETRAPETDRTRAQGRALSVVRALSARGVAAERLKAVGRRVGPDETGLAFTVRPNP